MNQHEDKRAVSGKSQAILKMRKGKLDTANKTIKNVMK